MNSNTKNSRPYFISALIVVGLLALGGRFCSIRQDDASSSAEIDSVSPKTQTTNERFIAAMRKADLERIKKENRKGTLTPETESFLRDSLFSMRYEETLKKWIAVADAECRADELSAAECEARKLNQIQKLENYSPDNQPDSPTDAVPLIKPPIR